VFYPTHALVTAQEILFFWVARMIMAGLEFMGDVPFADVYLNGTVRDTQRRKMSKSLGNGIDPLEVVRIYGADALRYTVIAAQGLGTDVIMDPANLDDTFAPGRNFANKIWNAGRFVLMNVDGDPVAPLDAVADDLELADRWILSRLDMAAEDVTRRLDGFRFDEAAQAVYHFFRGELADWYLELVKPRLREDAEPKSRAAARATLVAAFDGVMRLLHPIMPFITEALWLQLPVPSGEEREASLVIARWPAFGTRWRDVPAEAELDALRELIERVRSLRSEYDVPPGSPIGIQLRDVSPALDAALAKERHALERLARVNRIDVGGNGGDGAGAHAVLRGGTELFVPLADLIDIDRERQRLQAEIDRLDEQVHAVEARLGNAQFVERAPAAIVEKEREKADSFRDQRERLSTKLAALG
jgi:valyl-tRNA synthetase